MGELLLVHFHEIALKGRNRPVFVKALVRNLRDAVGDSASEVRSLGDRLEILDPKPTAIEKVRRVFGVANVSPARVIDADADQITEAVMTLARATERDDPFSTFAVRARRARTSFSVRSQELNERIGELIRTGLSKRVDQIGRAHV